MSDRGDESLVLSRARRIDAVCDRFESDWKAGKRPRIEEFLGSLAGVAERAALLKSLLCLEIELTSRDGVRPDPVALRKRFPEDRALIEEICESVLLSPLSSAVGDDPEAATLTWKNSITETARERKAPPESLRGQTLGRFELIDELGRGGFGTVYLARDPQLDRLVALKVPKIGVLQDEEDLQRFFREARAAAQLQHPHIVPVYEAGKIGESCYIAAGYVEGTTLRNRLRNGPQFSPREVVVFVSQLAGALHYAHLRGIIHRDVKPENVMITARGEPQIMDFGLARRHEGDQLRTQEGVRMGTPAYMSPEQAEGKSHLADARSDLWSVGVILFELLTGKRPFEGSVLEVMRAILEAEPPSPRRNCPSIPRDLETICLKCLARNPDQRYPSAQHLADDLQRWLEHRPVLARRSGPFIRAAKWARRNPVLALTSGVASIVALSAIVYEQTRPGYLDLHVTPPDAEVFLDDNLVPLSDGRALVERRPGHYQLRAAAKDFVPREQEVALIRGRDNAAMVSVELKSVFGYVEAETQPSGAAVEVHDADGKVVQRGTTPFRSPPLPAGRYRLRFARDMYLPLEVPVEVPDGYRTAQAQTQNLELAVSGAASFESLTRMREKLAETLAAGQLPELSSQTPLRDAMDLLGRRFGIVILIDQISLKQSGIADNPELGRSHSLGSLSLGNALQQILDPLKLSYSPSYDRKTGEFLLMVRSRVRAREEFVQVLHPVGDLVQGPFGLDGYDFSRRLTVDVDPISWDSVGGPGTIRYMPIAQCLVVKQVWQTHFQLDAYLSDLRRARAANERLQAAAAQASGQVKRSQEPVTSPVTEDGITIDLKPVLPAIGSVVNGTASWGFPLNNRPAESLVKEPPYKSNRPLYGTVMLREGDDPAYTFAMDPDDNRIYFDLNNDEDLTNDGSSPLSKDVRSRAASFDLQVAYPDRTLPYRILLYRDPQNPAYFRCQPDTARGGELRVGDITYAVAIADTNLDGRFDDLSNCLLLIDLDRDQKFDGVWDSAELYSAADAVNVAGTVIEIASITRDGLKMVVRTSHRSVEPRAILKPGFPAPDFAAMDLDGKPIRLSDFRGKHVLLYGWSAGGLNASQPQLFPQIAANVRSVQERFPESQLVVVGIALETAAAQAKAAVGREKLTHPHIFQAGNPQENRVALAYRTGSYGTGFLIDRDGKIAAVLSLAESVPAAGKSKRPSRFVQTLTEILEPDKPAE